MGPLSRGPRRRPEASCHRSASEGSTVRRLAVSYGSPSPVKFLKSRKFSRAEISRSRASALWACRCCRHRRMVAVSLMPTGRTADASGTPSGPATGTTGASRRRCRAREVMIPSTQHGCTTRYGRSRHRTMVPDKTSGPNRSRCSASPSAAADSSRVRSCISLAARSSAANRRRRWAAPAGAVHCPPVANGRRQLRACSVARLRQAQPDVASPAAIFGHCGEEGRN